MQYYGLCTAVTFVMYQKVHLLLDDITAWRVMKAVWEVCKCTELCSVFQSYIHNSHFLHGFMQITAKLHRETQMQAEDQKQ